VDPGDDLPVDLCPDRGRQPVQHGEPSNSNDCATSISSATLIKSGGLFIFSAASRIAVEATSVACQLGDPVKGAALIREVVGEDKLPGHLLLGADALDRWQVKVDSLADDVQAWRVKSVATAHAD
jgi:hypothetical protein